MAIAIHPEIIDVQGKVMRLHIGTGCIYLTDGYVNIDVWGSGCALAKDCPAGVAKWGTTSGDYYAKVAHINQMYLDNINNPPDHQQTVCDLYGNWTNLPVPDDSVDEILSRQTFEHLSKTESRFALADARRVMKSGAILRLDVPDHKAALQEYAIAYSTAEDGEEWGVSKENRIKAGHQADFMLRHLLGSRKNDWAYHMGSWTKEKLIAFCTEYGFNYVGEEDNIHFYPAFCLRFEKLPKCEAHPELDFQVRDRPAWEYADLPFVTKDMRVLEIGPGNNPWPYSTAFVDCVIRDYRPLIVCSVEDMTAFVRDKEFDYVLALHVLEHVDDPVKAASELSRVAKAGCIVCPSPFKEGLFAAHEQDHKWWVFQSGDTLYFKRIPEGLYNSIYSAEISGEMHRIWRYGERRIETVCNSARKWFYDNQPKMDVIHHWTDHVKVIVLP